jgi:hypothetical protein
MTRFELVELDHRQDPASPDDVPVRVDLDRHVLLVCRHCEETNPAVVAKALDLTETLSRSGGRDGW